MAVEALADSIKLHKSLLLSRVLVRPGVGDEVNDGPLSSWHQLENNEIDSYHEHYQYQGVKQSLEQIATKTQI
jgi:hypothetical protein